MTDRPTKQVFITCEYLIIDKLIQVQQQIEVAQSRLVRFGVVPAVVNKDILYHCCTLDILYHCCTLDILYHCCTLAVRRYDPEVINNWKR
jgi:hypothetical protein